MSFCLSSHLAPLSPTRAHWLDDAPDLSCKGSTGQHAVDGCQLSCNSRLGVRVPASSKPQLTAASVALSTLLQVAVAATLVGYLTAGATPVWLLGSFAVLSLLYRRPRSAPIRRPPALSAPPTRHRRAPRC